MDPALSSLFPVHQIGADGFAWWVGQIESSKNGDPKKSGRYQVRVVGQHLKDCDATPSDQLPWAQVMMPVTSPFSDGGVTGATVDLREGNWVVGFYLDNDKQKPIIMGSIGHTAGATKRENVETDPAPGEACKSFTTFLSPESNPNLHTPMGSEATRKGDTPSTPSTAETKGTTKVGEAGQIAAAVPGQMPAAFNGLFAEASTTNPTGNKVCVEIANPNCGSENDLKGGLTNIIGEMLKATQQSGGNVGTYYVSQVNGELNSYIDHGMEYVNKAVRLVKSFVARVKGEIVKILRDGVDQLVDLILYTDVPDPDELGNVNTGPVAPDLGIEPFKPITKKESRIKPILDGINDVLEDLGCEMADFTDKIASWLTDLLLGYLMDAYSNAACLVNNVVDGILNQILAFIEELLAKILGPIQEILALIASPLDIIGNVVAKVLGLLGISCDGPPDKCEKVTKECVDCGSGETEDWLDDLIAALESGPLDGSSYVCDEAKNTSALDSLPGTEIVFVGGTQPDGEQDPFEEDALPTDILISYSSEDIEVTEGEKAVFTITRGGNVTKPSSLKVTILGGTATLGEDYNKVSSSSSIGFAPGAESKEIVFETYKDNSVEGPEVFYIKIEENMTPDGVSASFPGGNVFKCTILDFVDSNISPSTGGDVPENPYVPPSIVNVNDVLSSPSLTVNPSPVLEAQYIVTTDKPFYKEGETIVYSISTLNVTNLGPYSYTLEGDIDENDIVGGSLEGQFTLSEDGTATVEVEVAVNDDIPDEVDTVVEDITFYITGTPAYASAFIVGEDDPIETDIIWSVTSDVNYIDEGETVNFTVGAFNAPDGLNFTYKLKGDISTTDIVGYRTESRVDIDGKDLAIAKEQCLIPIQAAADGDTTEGNEEFEFIVSAYNVDLEFENDGEANKLTEVKMVIQGVKYDLGSFDVKLIRPGMTFKKSVSTYLVPDDTVVESVDYDNNTITLNNDLTFFSGQRWTATSSRSIENVDERVVIRDTILEDADVTPSYSVTSDKFTYNEGETIIYTIETTNVPNGTVLQYTLYGVGINKSDFDNNSLFGNFTVIDNKSKVYVGIANDTEIEQNETLTFAINGTNAFTDVIILSDVDGEEDSNIKIPKKPCFDKPIAGKPITDDKGSIISIPILDQGCPYVFPPKVLITGPGYGASAIALLDASGKVSEIRVTRVGTGYNINRDPGLRCVIDSYTLLSPGKGYTSEPEVYVDGVAGRARAIIDERGYVISVQPTDRTSTWEQIPIVRLIGGGGSGARVLPSVTCLDNKTYEDQGYAKIGTGKYVDCP